MFLQLSESGEVQTLRGHVLYIASQVAHILFNVIKLFVTLYFLLFCVLYFIIPLVFSNVDIASQVADAMLLLFFVTLYFVFSCYFVGFFITFIILYLLLSIIYLIILLFSNVNRITSGS